MNGSNPGPHFTLSQAIAKFFQALRSKSRIWHQPYKSWGPSAATSASPSPTNSHQLVLLRAAEASAVTAQNRARCLFKSGLAWRDYGVPLPLHSVPKKVFPSSIKVCLHPAPIQAFHKNKKPNKHPREKSAKDNSAVTELSWKDSYRQKPISFISNLPPTTC